MKKKIYFEKLFFYHLPFFLYHILKKDEIIVFDWERKLVKKGWLVPLHDRKLFSFFCYYVSKGGSLALDAVDPVYKLRYKSSPMINSMCKLYESQDITMAYKKELAIQLDSFYAMHILLKEESDKIKDEKTVLYAYEYDTLLNLIKQSGSFYHDLKNVRIPFVVSFVSKIHRSLSSLIYYIPSTFIALALSAFIALRRLLSRRKEEAKGYDYVIPIYDFDFQLRSKTKRTFDFLLDNRNIKKDNTLFLVTSDLKPDLILDLKSRGYNIFQCNNVLNIFKSRLTGDYRSAFRILIYCPKSLFFSLSQPISFLFLSIKLTLVCGLWNMILGQFKFKNLVTFNELAGTHLARNILLNNHDCRTWLYAHSGSFGFVLSNKDVDLYESRDWRYSFLNYNNCALWNEDAIAYHKLHPGNKIDNYYDIGCMWSELIKRYSSEDLVRNYIKHISVKKRLDKEYKIVSFFEISYSYAAALDMGIDFYQDILRLLSDEIKIFAIIKPKKKHAVKDFFYFPYRKEFFAIIEKLNNHPRCYVAAPYEDSAEIIAVSDLIISHTFTSATLEAFGARKRTFFYDPGNKREGYYYDKMPGLVIHNYEGLKRKVDQLLFETSDENYNIYLDTNVLHKLDNYLDGKAITRFQKLLAGENPDEVLTARSEDLNLQKNLIKKV